MTTEAAADVRGDDPDLVLLEPHVPRHQGEDRANDVRRLGGHPDRQLPRDLVERGHAATGLDRGHVDARDVDLLADHDVRLLDRRVRRGLVADFPVEDVVVLLVRLVRAQDRRAFLQRLEGVHDDRQRLVLDLDRVGAVRRRVAVGRDDGGDLLRLVHDAVGREHHLRIRHQGRHPVQLVLLERGPRDHGQNARHLQRFLGVDRFDLRVRVGAAHDIHVEHAGQLDVVDVVALTAQEPRILLALDRVAHPSDFGRRLRCVRAHVNLPFLGTRPGFAGPDSDAAFPRRIIPFLGITAPARPSPRAGPP